MAGACIGFPNHEDSARVRSPLHHMARGQEESFGQVLQNIDLFAVELLLELFLLIRRHLSQRRPKVHPIPSECLQDFGARFQAHCRLPNLTKLASAAPYL